MDELVDLTLPDSLPLVVDERGEILSAAFECICDKLKADALRLLRAECIVHPRDFAADAKIIATIDDRLAKLKGSQLIG